MIKNRAFGAIQRRRQDVAFALVSTVLFVAFEVQCPI
jgi:hypothetical protein